MKERLYLNGQAIIISEDNQIKEGGEAYLYRFRQGKLLKVFREPDDYLYEGDRGAQEAAKNRIMTHQTKLHAFPKNLPGRVIAPQAIARDEDKRILGYTMRFIENATELSEYTDEAVRREHNVTNETVLGIFRDLHHTVSDIHEADVVIGDFNDTNVLVRAEEAYIIDADSFQFGNYPSRLFQPDFLDPLLIDPKARGIEMRNGARQTADTDWYAYNTMLIQNLLLVKPYGGLYTPNSDITKKERREQRITIFNSQVELSDDVIHYDMLPDELLQHFQDVFEKDKRGQFPAYLLDMRWTTCRRCGAEHARNVCPKHTTTTRKKPVEYGEIQASTIFERNPGFIIASAYQKGQLRYLYHENGEYRREDGSVLRTGDLDLDRKFEIDGKITVEQSKDQALQYDPSAGIKQRVISLKEGIAKTDDAKYWISHDKLWREDRDENLTSSQYIEYREGKPLFWVGEDNGLVCTKDSGGLKPAFVFDAQDLGTQYPVESEKIPGELVDSACYFDNNFVWLLTSSKIHGETINRCTVINQRGEVVKQVKAKAGSNTWLGTLDGKTAFDNSLLTPTDSGIEQFAIEGKTPATTKYPETGVVVNRRTHLVRGENELYAVNSQEITRLRWGKPILDELKFDWQIDPKKLQTYFVRGYHRVDSSVFDIRRFKN